MATCARAQTPQLEVPVSEAAGDDNPTLQLLWRAVRSARERLQTEAQEADPGSEERALQPVGLNLTRGSVLIESPDLAWAPFEWDYVVATGWDRGLRLRFVCIDHDARFGEPPQVNGITDDRVRAMAFRALHKRHFADVDRDAVVFLVSIRCINGTGTMAYYRTPFGRGAVEERTLLTPEQRYELSRRFGLEPLALN